MAVPQETFRQTSFNPTSFWGKKRQLIYQTTVPCQLQALKDTGRYDAFNLRWHESYSDAPDHWPVPNHLFWDSDIAKWIEGACYFLEDQTLCVSSEIRKQIASAVDHLVRSIQTAQQPDGYLNIHFTVVDPEGRWSNLRDLHELYNAGHLIEGALAHEQLSRKPDFLESVCKYVELISATFGPGSHQRHGYPGHPEIELALLRLHRRTKDPKHLALAKYFITERGNPKGQNGRHYYDVEAEARGDRPNEIPGYYPSARSYWYQQAHQPIRDQETIEGHSVRATYLLTAVADLVGMEKDQEGRSNNEELQDLRLALIRLWDNMTQRKMYLTGGIGAMDQWEGFGIDYFLPQSTDEGGCYAETCAAIGVMMLAERLLQIDLDGRYADVLELCLFNAMLGGISLDGKMFTYENQLASSDVKPSQRHKWFTCACCPPNVCRVAGYLGGYLWSFKEEKSVIEVKVHLYGDAKLNIKDGITLKQSSNWPWQGDVAFELENQIAAEVIVKLRIPHYVQHWILSPPISQANVERGYLILDSHYLQENPVFKLCLSIPPRLITTHPYTNQSIIGLAKGPIVYCLEDVDNLWVKDHFKSVALHKHQILSNLQEKMDSTTFEGEPFVSLSLHDAASFINLPPHAEPMHNYFPSICAGTNGHRDIQTLNFIPFYLRANRGGAGQMRVGLRVAEPKANGRVWSQNRT